MGWNRLVLLMVYLPACGYPPNPDACANVPDGGCPEGMYCSIEGNTSICLPRQDGPGDAPTERIQMPDGGDGPGCPTVCNLGDRQCQDGNKVAECQQDGACTAWTIKETCEGVQTCGGAVGSAMCACPSTCALRDLRCSESGLQVCVMQAGCPSWGPAEAWKTESVDTNAQLRTAEPSIALVDGRANVLYRTEAVAGGSYGLKHAVRAAGGVWDSVDVEAASPAIVTEPVLRVDAAGTLHAAYVLFGTGARLRAGSKSSSAAWAVQDVPPAAMPQNNVSNLDLAVRGDTVALVYDGEGSSTVGHVGWLRIRSALAPAWGVAPIDSGSEMSTIYPSAAVTADGKVVLSYFSTKFRRLIFSNRVQNDTLEDAEPMATGYVSRAVIDSGAAAHVLAGGPSVRHFFRGANGWESVPVSARLASDLRALADEQGGIHAVFKDDQGLKYARKPATGSWSVTPIPLAPTVTVQRPDIAISAEWVHVVYGLGSGTIQYATGCR